MVRHPLSRGSSESPGLQSCGITYRKTGKWGDRGAPEPQDLAKSLQGAFKLRARDHNPLREAHR